MILAIIVSVYLIKLKQLLVWRQPCIFDSRIELRIKTLIQSLLNISSKFWFCVTFQIFHLLWTIQKVLFHWKYYQLRFWIIRVQFIFAAARESMYKYDFGFNCVHIFNKTETAVSLTSASYSRLMNWAQN